MAQRPFSIFSLTENQAIELLQSKPEDLDDPSDRYIAASQLVNHPSDRTVQALMTVLKDLSPDLNSRIVRRKSVETLGYLKAELALPAICECLQSDDRYTVENAVWSIGEIGTVEEPILQAITALLDQPDQGYRLIIQTLAKLKYSGAIAKIREFTTHADPMVANGAIAALVCLTGDDAQINTVIAGLQHDEVNVRRSSIQDLIDTKCYQAIPAITKSPVSVAFRLRGVRSIGEMGLLNQQLTFGQILPAVDRVILDHPKDLELVHEYDQPPTVEFLLNELYETDFGRCYLATQTLLQHDPQSTATELLENYRTKAQNDYGAHYHVIKLLGWLHYQPAYDRLIEALHNPAPQFQKSRMAAAIALGQLGDKRAIVELQPCLDSEIWTLRYASLCALHQLGDVPLIQRCCSDDDQWLATKAKTLTSS